MRKKIFFTLFNVCITLSMLAQQTDSITEINHSVTPVSKKNLYNKTEYNIPSVKSFIIPTAFVTFGFIALGKNDVNKLSLNTKSELQEDNPKFATKIDNYLQYSPAIAVYALNALGIKGKNNFRDRTMIYGISTIISSVTVLSLKKITKEERPDGSGNNSFPSGHTTTAFAAAEFLRMEYKDVSPWYGIAGYVAATATGVLRLYNNKHWVNDIVAGAGFGIISTKLAYWIYPSVKRKFFKDKKLNTMIVPYYNAGNTGLSMVHNF